MDLAMSQIWRRSASVGLKVALLAKKFVRQSIHGEWRNPFFAQDACESRLSLLCMGREKLIQFGAVAMSNRIYDPHMLADVDLHLRFEDISLSVLDFINQDQQPSDVAMG